MRVTFYQVDAFASSVFGGNPAAVCPLEQWLDDDTLQKIAAENNVSETAFFVQNGAEYDLRWFTPTVEVHLCGHATLASGFVLMNQLGIGSDQILFNTRSGQLRVFREGGLYALDFPARPPERCPDSEEVATALGARPTELWAARDYMAVFESESDVRALQPDMDRLAKLEKFAVIATAPGNQADFVSRFFAPSQGIPEDPVTGSAHCTLIPYWADRLGRTRLQARQVSSRGGDLLCVHDTLRVIIAGDAALYAKGEIYLE